MKPTSLTAHADRQGQAAGPSRAQRSLEIDRAVELFARDLQTQEHLMVQMADRLQEHLAPKGVGVVLEAEHLCMCMGGVQKFVARRSPRRCMGSFATTLEPARSF
jgi:GTP cyclohydrolase I